MFLGVKKMKETLLPFWDKSLERFKNGVMWPKASHRKTAIWYFVCWSAMGGCDDVQGRQ